MTLELREVHVRNIRSYPEGTVRFGPGTTLLTGDVGSGKTSLLYAIEMALFGFAEVDATHLIRHRATEAEVRLVLADDAHRYELARRFRRTSHRGRETFKPVDSSYAVDGARTKYSPTELRQRAIDLLGFPDNPNPVAHSDLWRWAVYVPQEKMREILGSAPQERLETIRKALGLEQYRMATENAQTLVRELQTRAEVREAKAEQLRSSADELSQWIDALTERRNALAVAREEVAMVKIALDEANATFEKLEAQRLRLEAERKESEALEAQLALTRERHDERSRLAAERAREVARFREELAGLPEAVRALKELGEAAESHRKSLVQIRIELEGWESTRRELARLQAALAAAERSELAAIGDRDRVAVRQAEARALLEQRNAEPPTKEPPCPIPRSVEEIDEALGLLDERRRQSRAEFDQVAREATELEQMTRTGLCPRCGQRVTAQSASGHLHEIRALRERRQRELDEVEQERVALTEARSARTRYDRNLERWREADRRRTDARERLIEREEELRQATSKLETFRSEKTALEVDRNHLPPVERLVDEGTVHLRAVEVKRADAEAAIFESQRQVDRLSAAQARQPSLEAEAARLHAEGAELERETGRIQDRIDELHREEERRGSLDDRLAAARRSREETQAALEAAGSALGRLESGVTEAEREIQESETAIRERDRLRNERTHLLVLARWLGGPFREALEVLERRVLSRARDQFDRALARNFSTLVEDPALLARCDSAFAPEIEIDGEWTPAEALSGGERTALALAYRLALGTVVRSVGQLNLATLILDEPTDGFSPEQVQKMGDLLDELAIPQIVLVSHEAALGSVADRVVRIRKLDGRSSVDDEGRGGFGAPPKLATPPRRVRSRRTRTVTLESPPA